MEKGKLRRIARLADIEVEQIVNPLTMEDKYIGLFLAITSSLAIGTSFIFTKLGLNAASEENNFQGAGFNYLRNPIWWGGMSLMVVGEVANFAAYTFAPAIMVTPLGALSVIIGAILAAVFLKEELGTLGKLGCTICLLGSIIIILHAPSDKEISTVDEILGYAMQPAFVFYIIVVSTFSLFMIYKVVPHYGTKNPMVYISICSLVGSISVMAIKASFWYCLKVNFKWQQPVYTPFYLPFPHRRCCMHHDTDELFQQGIGSIRYIYCQPIILRYVHYSYSNSLVHLI